MFDDMIDRLYFEWPDGSHETRRLSKVVDPKAGKRLAKEVYSRCKVKPNEVIAWNLDGIAVFALESTPDGFELVDCL